MTSGRLSQSAIGRVGNFPKIPKTVGNLSQNRLGKSEILYTDVSPNNTSDSFYKTFSFKGLWNLNLKY